MARKKNALTKNVTVTDRPKRRVARAKQPEPVMEAETLNEVLPSTLGAILQQARHQQHLKLSSVSKKLCIKEIYLEALEHGHYYAFPALVYGAGFLRAYATFLGLNADELAERFRQETTDIKSETLDMPRTTDPNIIPSTKTIVKSLLVLVFLYLIWSIFKIVSYNPMPELPKPAVNEELTQAETVVPEAPVIADELKPAALVKNKTSLLKENQKTALAPVLPKESKPVADTPRAGVSYGLKTPARVSFLATDTVQIEIRDTEADSILFQKTLEAGDRYNPVNGVEGMVLRTTNAGGLDVYVDGKKIKALGKKGQIKAGVSMDAADLLKD